jgi:hypothetical protein
MMMKVVYMFKDVSSLIILLVLNSAILLLHQIMPPMSLIFITWKNTVVVCSKDVLKCYTTIGSAEKLIGGMKINARWEIWYGLKLQQN